MMNALPPSALDATPPEAQDAEATGALPVELEEILTATERQALAQGVNPPAQGPPPPPDNPGDNPGPGAPQPSRAVVVGGRLMVVPGDARGERAIVEPGPHVLLWVNGKAVSGPRMVDSTDELAAEGETVAPVARASVRLSDDRMEAWLIIERVPGTRYGLRDAPPSVRLRLEAEPIEEMAAPPVGPEAVQAALDKAGVRFGVHPEAIDRALAGVPGQPVLVAEGTRPVEPVDGHLELRFSERSAPAVDPHAERIDLFERGAITWVRPGDVLAVVHAAREGTSGMDVLGRAVPVRRPSEVKVRAGKGATLSEDGRQVVAAQEGRPLISGGTITVLPVYEVAGNADVSTGHVRFGGDVHVRGDVLDNVEVTAGGDVRVGGLVSMARIRAGGSVTVGRTIVGSHVEAGGQAALLSEVMPVVVELSEQLQSLVAAAQQLHDQVQRLRGELAPSQLGPAARLSDGEIVKRLLERKFWEVPKLAARLGALGESLEAVAPGSRRVGDRAVRHLTGIGPLRLSGLSELAELANEVAELQQSCAAMTQVEADVVAFSIQNSRVEASHRVIVRGSGAYNSTLVGARGVDVRRGVVRGGQVLVTEGDVFVRELGSSTGVNTLVTVGRKGKVVATVVHPNVTISIAGQKQPFPDGARALRAYVGADGRLVAEYLKAEWRNHANREHETAAGDDQEGKPS